MCVHGGTSIPRIFRRQRTLSPQRIVERRAGRLCYHRAVHGGQRSVSRRDVLKYAAPVLLGLGAAAAPVDEPRRGRRHAVIDFAERRITPDEIKAAGYGGVVNYVSASRPGANFKAKPITREYATRCARGASDRQQFQYGNQVGPTRRISPAGTTAGWLTLTRPCNCTMQRGRPLPRSSSASMTTSTTTPGTALQSNGFEESTRSLGVGRTGIYGHAQACGWAIRDGVIGNSSTPGHRWAGRRDRGRTGTANRWRCFIRPS